MSFYNNSDWYQTFTVTSGGVAVDLTGKTLKLTWREEANSANTIAEASTTGGEITITDGPAGEFALNLPYGTTQNFPSGNHYWDLLDVVSATSQTRMAGGRWLVREGIGE